VSPETPPARGGSLVALGLLAIVLLPSLMVAWEKARAWFFGQSAKILAAPLALAGQGRLNPQLARTGPPLTEARALAAAAARIWLWGLLPAQALLAIWILATFKAKSFRRELATWDLVKLAAAHRPCLTPLVKVGPITERSALTGPWALAETPLGLVLKHRAYLQPRPEGGWRAVEAGELIYPETGLVRRDLIKPRGARLEANLARQVFANQLGPRIQNLKEDLTSPYRELTMAFWAQSRDLKALALKIIDELGFSWDPKTQLAESSSAQKLWAELDEEELPDEIKRHLSFRNPLMMGFLKSARRLGILPPAMFIWLRPTDRSLYYALNQMGAQMAWAEGAGSWAHFLTENQLGRALMDPAVERAVKSLAKGLWRDGWLGDPRDYWPKGHDPQAEDPDDEGILDDGTLFDLANPTPPDQPATPDKPDYPAAPLTNAPSASPSQTPNPCPWPKPAPEGAKTPGPVQNPAELNEPSSTNQTERPEKAGKPARAATPAEPDNPDHPVEPDEPGNPGQPDESDLSFNPESPGQPEEPELSPDPDNPGLPADLDEFDYPDGPNPPNQLDQPDHPNQVADSNDGSGYPRFPK
jgi:hypothetical protein